jgi:hypothetical protein
LKPKRQFIYKIALDDYIRKEAKAQVIVSKLVKMGYKSISWATDQVVPEIQTKSVPRLFASQTDFASGEAGPISKAGALCQPEM